MANDPMRGPLFTLSIGAAMLSAVVLMIGVASCSPSRHPRNAVVIILDTLRQDRLRLYGGARDSTPVLDRLAAEGVVFEQVVTNSTWTLPALSALFSGQYLTAEVFDRGLRQSMVEELREAGFATVAFTEGGFFSSDFGMDLGFGLFNQITGAGQIEEGMEIAHTFGQARDWLIAHPKDEPFFLVVHTYEPHTPYLRPTFVEGLDAGQLDGRWGTIGLLAIEKGLLELSPSLLEYIRALYDGGLAESDRYVGELLATLEELELAADTLIVVTSDHGEDLGDRESRMPGAHGHTLFDEQALVPLIIRDPTNDYPIARVSAQVRTIDTMHTVFDLLGLTSRGRESESRGRSLVPLMVGDETEGRPAFIRVQRNDVLQLREMYALRDGQRKLITLPKRKDTGEAVEYVSLFDLSLDPGETVDIAKGKQATAVKMRARLLALRSELDAHGRPVLKLRDRSPALQERLRALGYVE